MSHMSCLSCFESTQYTTFKFVMEMLTSSRRNTDRAALHAFPFSSLIYELDGSLNEKKKKALLKKQRRKAKKLESDSRSNINSGVKATILQIRNSVG